ncbi:zinc finger CCHC domain-containing protein 4 [Cephus cinctus]|uniref:Zinc finger CCHC domain-containing protein 4 n=1 Tax=Cephus cinctus TaxID=211228 RepID=A0AAJ7RQ95_CEPCN|nr:zinc finger CCHC domain-containing protein 4 [Cephus cinctus]
MIEIGGLQCVWGKLETHPKCPHGPTLLLEKHVDGKLQQFYSCSAYRDATLCSFYVKPKEKLTKEKKQRWEQELKKLPKYNHHKLYIHFNELMVVSPEKRAYCHNCEKLIFMSEITKHNEHLLTKELTDTQMNNPTTFLKPLTNAKKEAQYLFSEKSVNDIMNILLNMNADQVLCIGAPRIHEHICANYPNKISSLLLDFDGRFHNFFGPLSFCWYNLFNHHFFHEESENVFKDFLTQNGGKNMYLICDPPFGGRMEAMSQTIKTISDLYKKLNKIENDDELKIMFISPYFMESIMKQKSNPSGVSGGLKDLQMCDYKVDYDNHPLFLTGSNGRKQGSPVRIFTNIPLNLIELPTEDGYRYCKQCQKWIASENKHCKKCKQCTSKDGRRYKHCEICQRCVKPTWKHCNTCKRCILEKHICGQTPKITGQCFKCNAFGHIEKDCKFNIESFIEIKPVKKLQKRKSDNIEEITVKKKKIDSTSAKQQETNKGKPKTTKLKESVSKKSKNLKMQRKPATVLKGKTNKNLPVQKLLKNSKTVDTKKKSFSDKQK